MRSLLQFQSVERNSVGTIEWNFKKLILCSSSYVLESKVPVLRHQLLAQQVLHLEPLDLWRLGCMPSPPASGECRLYHLTFTGRVLSKNGHILSKR